MKETFIDIAKELKEIQSGIRIIATELDNVATRVRGLVSSLVKFITSRRLSNLQNMEGRTYGTRDLFSNGNSTLSQ